MHTRDRFAKSPTMRRWIAPLISLLCAFRFFYEYVSRRAYIPFDLPSFHFPLADYAFLAVRHGRLPEWDPSNYAGMPFAANPQAALFYPGTWALFAIDWRREHLSFVGFEILLLAHLWIAWVVCFAWLRRRLGTFASACGAMIFAGSGYPLAQMQHFGVVAGYAWIPLGWMGIDQAEEQGSWRPLWKTAAASALAFLAGYTPTWFAVTICLLSYAFCRRGGWKMGAGCCAALAVSLGLVMIQLLPAAGFSALRVPEVRYGLGIRDPAFYISYLIPNFYDFGKQVPVETNFGRDYLYLGVPGLVGLALLLFFRRSADQWSAAPLAGMLAACAVIVTNPFNVISGIVLRSTLVAQICRDYYFLAGLTAAAAPLAAIGIDRFLRRDREAAASLPRSKLAMAAAIFTIALLAAVSIRLAYIWRRSDFRPGWAGAWDVGIFAALFLAGLWLLRGQKGWLRMALAAALLLAAGVDYKVHGTSKRFNSSAYAAWRTNWMPGMNASVMQTLEANSVYRLALDQTGPLAADLRHFGLTTPEGWDPFLTTAYSKFIRTTGTFLTNWDIAIDPQNLRGIQTLGVGYFVSAEQGPQFAQLKTNPQFRLLQPDDSFYKVFEVIDKRPPYGIDGAAGGAAIERTRWEPEHRAFVVNLATAGKFYLSEQWNPGWRARVDGREAEISRWNEAFQAVRIPEGQHRVEFNFEDQGLRIGAMVSLATLAGVIFAMARSGGTTR